MAYTNSDRNHYSRKPQKRSIPLIRIILIALTVSVIWYLADEYLIPDTYNKGYQEANVLPLGVEQPLNITLEQYREKLIRVVKPGDTFLELLQSCDISHSEAIEYYQTLKPLGLKSLNVGDSLIIKKGLDGSLKDLSILSKLEHWYKVTNSDTAINAEKSTLAKSSYRCLVNGTLESCLSEDLHKLGLSDALAGKFADIFAWDINFFLDPRKGDSFQILFEQKFAEGKFVGYGEIIAAKYTLGNKVFTVFGLRDEKGIMHYYDQDGKSIQKQFLKAPLRFSRISSKFSFNRRHPVLGIVRPHLGIDYAAPKGTPVYAAATGTVMFSGWKGGYGNYVEILHGASYQTCYGHLHNIAKGIRRGTKVTQGELIGTVGSTGLSTGPHLDYRMKIGPKYVNPMAICPPSSEGITEMERQEFETVKQSSLAAFDLRFAKQSGCHILDIDIAEPQQEATNTISRNVITSHASEPNL